MALIVAEDDQKIWSPRSGRPGRALRRGWDRRNQNKQQDQRSKQMSKA
jgi:hypothetical protein